MRSSGCRGTSATPGSVYALAGVTLGPQAGFFSGWALLGTYLAFTCASTAEAGTFGVAFFQGTGIWNSADYIWIALVAGVIIAILAYGDIRVATRSLLGMEGISVTLIVILMIVIVVKLIAGTSPHGTVDHRRRLQAPQRHVAVGGGQRGRVRLPLLRRVRGRGLARRGDRQPAARDPARDPQRGDRPRASSTSSASSSRPGASAPTPPARRRSRARRAPLGDLAHTYIGSGMEDLINAGATISAFASGLAAATAGARILFALSRGTRFEASLGRASTRTGAPAGALTVVLIVGIGAIVVQRLAGVNAVNAFFYPGHARRAEPARRLHRHQHRRDPASCSSSSAARRCTRSSSPSWGSRSWATRSTRT